MMPVIVGRNMKYIVLLLFLITKCSCDNDFNSRPRNFSIELIHFTQQQKEGHVVISPFGIWSLMSGIALGSAGRSYAQMSRAFLLPRDGKTLISGYKSLAKTVLGSTSKDVSLTSANFIFAADNFRMKPDFQRLVTSDFGAILKTLNFKNTKTAAQAANKVIQNSVPKVSNVLSSDDFIGSRMILTNVVSFKGFWTLPFNKSDTRTEPFYDEKRQIAGSVNMMYQKAEFPLSNIKALKAHVLEMPYGRDGKYCMLIILPQPNVKATEVYKKLETTTLKDIFNKLDEDNEEFGVEEIDVKIPRFKISTNIIMNKPLNDMGVYDIFEPDLANFKRVTNEKIYVSTIVHKADIEVTESGTTGTASSTATIADRKMTKFEANKPFVYFVLHKPTATIIFGGIYSKPSVF